MIKNTTASGQIAGTVVLLPQPDQCDKQINVTWNIEYKLDEF